MGNIVLPPVVLQPSCEGVITPNSSPVPIYSASHGPDSTQLGTITTQVRANVYDIASYTNGAFVWYFVTTLEDIPQSGWIEGTFITLGKTDCFPPPQSMLEILNGLPTGVPGEVNSNQDFMFPLMKAQEYVSEEKYAEAAELYEALLRVQPQHDWVLYQYGRVLLELDHPKDALNTAEQLIAINTQDVRAYVLQALANLKLDYPATALAAATKGYEIDPTDSDVLTALSQSYLQIGRFDEALKYGEAAVQANNNNAEAHRAYGWALAALGNRDEAILAFEQAIQYGVNRFSLYADLALQYKALNRMDDALATYEQILALQPDNTKALVAICETYTQVGNNDNAESYCNRAIVIDPTYAEAYKVLGGVHFRQRNYEAAIQDFDQCLALGSLAIECYYQRGLASFYIGDCDTAWSALTAASAFNPDQAIYEIINSGLKLITENCPKYKDLVIAIPTPDAGLSTPVPMTGGNDVIALATDTPAPALGIVEPTVIPPADVQTIGMSSGIACDSSNAVILSPDSKAVVAGKVEVTGIATGADFGSYRLELIGLATGSSYMTLYTSDQPVANEGRLGDLDLSTFPPENYGLRLLVFDRGNQVQGACLINFTLARTVEAQQAVDSATPIPRYTLPASATVMMETTALSSPFAGASASMQLIPGIAVTVDAQTQTGEWLHVTLAGGKNGWVSSNALQFGAATPSTGTTANQLDAVPSISLMPTGFVSVETAALREEPNADAKVIRMLPNNTAFGYLQFSEDRMWVLAALEDRTLGWILGSDVVGFSPAETKPAIQCSGTTGQQRAQLFSRPNFTGNAVPIGALDASSFVIILDLDNQAGNPTAWYYVQGLNNPALVGWVDGSALNITSYCPQVVPQPSATIGTVLPPTLVPPSDMGAIPAVPDMPMPVTSSICMAVNTSADSIPVYSGPSSDENESLLVNNLAPNTPAQVMYQQFSSDGRVWYLVLAVLDGGKQVSGWVNTDAVQLVGQNCHAAR